MERDQLPTRAPYPSRHIPFATAVGNVKVHMTRFRRGDLDIERITYMESFAARSLSLRVELGACDPDISRAIAPHMCIRLRRACRNGWRCRHFNQRSIGAAQRIRKSTVSAYRQQRQQSQQHSNVYGLHRSRPSIVMVNAVIESVPIMEFAFCAIANIGCCDLQPSSPAPKTLCVTVHTSIASPLYPGCFRSCYRSGKAWAHEPSSS